MMKILLRVSFLILFCVFLFTCKKDDIEQDKTLYYNLWVNYSSDSLIKEKLYLTSGNECYYIKCFRLESEFPECGKKYFYLADTIFEGYFKIFKNKLIIGNNIVFKIESIDIKPNNKLNRIITKEGKTFRALTPSIFEDKELQSRLEANEVEEPCDYYFNIWFKPFTVSVYEDSSYLKLKRVDTIIKTKFIDKELILYSKDNSYGFKFNKSIVEIGEQDLINGFDESFKWYPSGLLKVGIGKFDIKNINKKTQSISGNFNLMVYFTSPTIVSRTGLVGDLDYSKPIYNYEYIKSEHISYLRVEN